MYTLAEMLADLRTGVWRELSAPQPRIDPYRRNLQRAFLEAAQRVISPPTAPTKAAVPVVRPTGDARAVLRGELAEIDRAVQNAIGRTQDGMTRLHLRDVRMEIDGILNPED